MPITAHTVADGYLYEIATRSMPELGPNGNPTGGTVEVRVLRITDEKSMIEVVFTAADWDLFVQRVNGARIQVATSLPPGLLNGHLG